MPRGKPGRVTLRTEDGREIIGESVHAHAILPAEDVAALREYGRAANEGYAALLERLLREALAPVIQAAHDAKRERDALLGERMARAEELRRLIEEHREELQRLERETRRRGGE
jgi:hypothetical protein